VLEGVACHRAADAVFHELPVFRTQSRALTQALLAAGVPRGAARAVGHAGWELLFDGALVDDSVLVGAYLRAMSVEVGHASWAAALARRAVRGVPRFYADPASVAELLRRVLSERRLLAFDRSYLPAITACLAAKQPEIAASVPDVFAALRE
jgi:hypothetical protein